MVGGNFLFGCPQLPETEKGKIRAYLADHGVRLR
jgi:hypothetical protein